MDSVGALAVFLSATPSGPVADVRGLEARLAAAWSELGAEHLEATSADKFTGRIEDPVWAPPVLAFVLERHGGFVNGSTRAELHHWEVDLDNRAANLTKKGFRQRRPVDKRLDVVALASGIVEQVKHAVVDDTLEWSREGRRVRIKIGEVVPNTNTQTTAARRTRFASALEPMLRKEGWALVPGSRPHTYERVV